MHYQEKIPDRYLRLPEVCKRVGLSRQTLYRYMKMSPRAFRQA
jgi:predicted DNA-binding transcriptional regulator AlpA